MKLILAGGGDPQDSIEVDAFFCQHLGLKRILFLPHAVFPEIWSIEESLIWLKSQKLYNDCIIDVWEDLETKDIQEILSYDAIYIMGGNTYKLLQVIRDYKLKEVFQLFLTKEKIIYGLSAGAIIMGNSIDTADTGPEKDENYLNLKDLSGLDYLNKYLVAAHYINETKNDLIKLSKQLQRSIIAIPETSGVYVENLDCKVIGRDSVFLFNGDDVMSIEPQEEFSLI